jgi:hypothetical protein
MHWIRIQVFESGLCGILACLDLLNYLNPDPIRIRNTKFANENASPSYATEFICVNYFNSELSNQSFNAFSVKWYLQNMLKFVNLIP